MYPKTLFRVHVKKFSFGQFLAVKRLLQETASKFDNVHVYDFQLCEDIVCDYENYKDMLHFHEKINYLMIDSIREKKCIVRSSEIMNNINTLRALRNRSL